ncbi:MAG: hypothetical protein ACRC0Y_11100 [Fusobacteriaceae bacterium]
MEFNNNNKCSLWENKSKKGMGYISGYVQIDNIKYKISIFKNDFKKENSKEPDYKGIIDKIAKKEVDESPF